MFSLMLFSSHFYSILKLYNWNNTVIIDCQTAHGNGTFGIVCFACNFILLDWFWNNNNSIDNVDKCVCSRTIAPSPSIYDVFHGGMNGDWCVTFHGWLDRHLAVGRIFGLGYKTLLVELSIKFSSGLGVKSFNFGSLDNHVQEHQSKSGTTSHLRCG